MTIFNFINQTLFMADTSNDIGEAMGNTIMELFKWIFGVAIAIIAIVIIGIILIVYYARTKKCPHCHKRVPKKATVCVNCSHSFDAQLGVCSKCGTTGNHTDKFCSNCGNPMSK